MADTGSYGNGLYGGYEYGYYSNYGYGYYASQLAAATIQTAAQQRRKLIESGETPHQGAAALGSGDDRSADLAATQEEIEMLVLQSDMAERARLAGDRARQFYIGLTIGTVLTGMSVAVTAAVVGLAALMRHLRQMQYTRPMHGDAFS
eukprot:gene3973-4226_t